MKVAGPLGITVFLLEELGDARLRCNQLKDYIGEATRLIEKSEQREHFFEVAGHLLHGIPDTLMRLSKALDAAAMAAAKWDYESVKEDLRPEKAEQLEDALKDVRTRRVERRSSNPEFAMKTHEAAQELNRIAQSIEQTGHVDTQAITTLIAALEEGGAKRIASSKSDVVNTLRGLAASLGEAGARPNRAVLASALRRVVGETIDVAFAGADLGGTPYNMAEGFEFIKDAAITAYRRGSTGHQMRQAFDQLAALVSEIGLMCESIGSTDVPGLAIRLSKAVRMSRRLLTPDVTEAPMVMASEEKESRFEEGKPADPTENMSEEDASKWKTEHDNNKDNFKAAVEQSDETKEADGDKEAKIKAKSLVPKINRDKKYAEDDKLSRFEEGKPADPTKDMDDEDAAEWKQNTEEYGDKFKEASYKSAAKAEISLNYDSPTSVGKISRPGGRSEYYYTLANGAKMTYTDREKFRYQLRNQANVREAEKLVKQLDEKAPDTKKTASEDPWKA